MRFAPRAVSVVLAALALAACSTDLKIPDNVIVACQSPSDCPAGYHCTNGNICVPSTREDSTAPTVVSASFDNPHVKAGATATMTFVVSEQLLIDPVLTFARGSQTYTMTRTGFDASSLTYRYAYTATGSESEGQSVVNGALLDLAGNSNNENMPSIDLDFTPPAVSPGTATLQMLPNLQTNPLPTVAAITNTTRVRFGFSATEQLSVAPPLLVGGVQVIVMDTSSSTIAPTADFVWDAAFGVADGTYPPQVQLTDLAGNSATVAADTIKFIIDTVAPNALPVDTPGAVVLQREPWGHSGDIHQQSKVVGASGAAEVGATVLGYDTASLPACPINGCKFWAQSRATVNAQADGAFVLDFGGLDRSVVYIAAADAAGNVSNRASLDVPLTPAVVRDTQLTAITAISADTVAETGNTVIAVNELESMLPGMRAVDIPRDYTSVDSDGSTYTTSGAAAWKDLTPGPSNGDTRLINLIGPAAGYLPTRGQMVVFGGKYTKLPIDPNTYVRDGVTFSPVSTPNAPPGRTNGQMAYDPVNDALMLVGGSVSTDMWLWDGDAWTEACTTTACHNGPFNESYNGLLATDPTRRVVVFFGASGNIWEWNGAAWTLTCSGACTTSGPTAGQFGATFDPHVGALLAFGGADSRTWSWDGASWSQQCTSAACTAQVPSTRQNPALAYDVAHDKVVLFGGVIVSDPTQHIPNETWTWDGTSWTLVNTLDSTHYSRYGNALRYDGRRKVVASIGGTVVAGTGSLADESLEWDGTKWRDLTQTSRATPIAPGPSPAGITYDPQSGYVLASDGQTTYEWNGYQWFTSAIANTASVAGATQMATPATPTAGVRSAIMLTGTTVTYKLVSGAWQQMCSGCGLTGVTSMATDGTGVIIAAQGATHDVFRWNGSVWASACNGCTTHNSATSISYNGQAGQVVSLGPGGGVRDLFSAGVWSIVEASSSITPVNYALAWDAPRGRITALPGRRNGPPGTATFEFLWGDSAASPIASTSATPTFDLNAANGTFDEVRNESVSISSGGAMLAFRSGGATRPAHLFSIGLLGLVDPTQIQMSAIDVTWSVTASSVNAGAASTGIAFWVWNYDHWERVPATQVDANHWSTHIDDSTLTTYRKVNGLIFGPSSRIIVAASPDGTTGTGASFATVVTDFVQAQITYRHN